MDWKLPPKEKIYEAFSVIADNRYEIVSEGKAMVTSSGGDKKYTVTWIETGDALKVSSNDNASKWQGYTGYPIIAVLLIVKRIAMDGNIIPLFEKIHWNKLNKVHKNNYSSAVNEILAGFDNGISDRIRKEVDSIFNQLTKLKLIR